MEFQAFPKMARLSREVIITEKIDGTNAQVFLRELPDDEVMPTDTPIIAVVGHSPSVLIYAGSRTRYLTVENDNQGFARWVKEHAEELAQLGPGRHFGEWWGCGIQRGYGLTKGDKRFSLFNTTRWAQRGAPLLQIPNPDPRMLNWQTYPPECCGVVPVLYQGIFSAPAIDQCLYELEYHGSEAVPGYMKPEGVVVYHTQGNVGFKKTLEHDEQPKGRAYANV